MIKEEAKKNQDELVKAEGVTYEAGGFRLILLHLTPTTFVFTGLSSWHVFSYSCSL